MHMHVLIRPNNILHQTILPLKIRVFLSIGLSVLRRDTSSITSLSSSAAVSFLPTIIEAWMKGKY